MAFPRARLKRFNETHEKTPGVGAYNLAKDAYANDKASSLARINETLKNCRDKAAIAAEKGQLPKHVEEIHTKLAHAQERIVDLEILKIGSDKQRELTEKDKDDLRQKVAKLEAAQEKFRNIENDKQQLEKQISSHILKINKLEQQERQLHSKISEAGQTKEKNDKQRAKLLSELDKLKKSHAEIELVSGKQRDEISDLKRNLCSLHTELASVKEENASIKANQEQKDHCWAQERQTLISQKESLNFKCEEWERKYKKSADSSAQEVGSLLEANLQKVSEIEEKKKAIEHLEARYRDDMKKMQEQEAVLTNRLDQLEKNKIQLENESSALAQDLRDCELEKKQLDSENIDLTQKLIIAISEVHRRCQHLVDLDKKLRESSDQLYQLNTKHCHDIQDFEKEKLALTSEIESLNSDIESSDEHFKIVLEKHCLEIDALQEANAKKIIEMMSRNEELENQVSRNEIIVIHLQSVVESSQHKMDSLQETHDKVKQELNVKIENLKNKLATSVKDKETVESESEENEVKLGQALQDKEEMLESILLLQEDLCLKSDEFDLLKQTHEKAIQEMKSDSEFLNSQVKSYIVKCEELDEQLKNAKQIHEHDVELLREQNLVKLSEIEEENRRLENLVAQIEDDKKQLQADECRLREKLTVVEDAQMDLEKRSSSLTQDLTTRLLGCQEKNNALILENEDLMQKLDEVLGRLEKMEKDSIQSSQELKAFYIESLEKVEAENLSLKEQSQFWTEKQSLWEDKEKQFETRYTEMVTCNKDLEQQVSQKSQENEGLGEELKELNERIERIQKEHIHELKVANTTFADDIAKLGKDHKNYQEDLERKWREKYSSLEQEKIGLESKINLLEEDICQLQDKCAQTLANEELSQLILEKDANLSSLRDELARLQQDRDSYKNQLEAADQDILEYNNIITEMSEKIAQMENDKAEILSEFDEDEGWKSKYEDLVKRMEPFKDILDGFEMERQLLQEKEKFTSEQLEKLTQECIKNMGHQNHKQRIKYLEKIKQENLTLNKTICEFKEQIQRYEATIRKLKEKGVEKGETKKPWQRTPLKEDNHL